MKKVLLIATFGAMLASLSLYPTVSNADNSSELEIKSIHSEAFFDNYAEENYQSYLMSQLLLEDETSIENSYILGKPFTIAKANKSYEKFHYPIIGSESGKIKYVLEITDFEGRKQNEEPSVVISSHLAGTLEELKNSEDKSVILGYANGDLYVSEYEDGSESKKIAETPMKVEGDVKIEDVFQSEDNLEVVKVTEAVDIVNVDDIPNPQYQQNINSRAAHSGSFYSVITERIFETQDNRPWCGAYSMSGAINFKEDRKVYTAQQVMKSIYPNLSQAQLNKKNTNTTNLTDYAKRVGYKKTKYAAKPFTVGEVRNQLNQNNPLIMVLTDQQPPYYGGHATVLHGWTRMDNKDMYNIWNPWFARTQTVNANGLRFWTQNEYVFNWHGTIYDLQK